MYEPDSDGERRSGGRRVRGEDKYTKNLLKLEARGDKSHENQGCREERKIKFPDFVEIN